MTEPHDRYRYGRWHPGPDPLAPPADLTDATARLGDEIMGGASPRGALDELLRRGTRETTGLDGLTRRLWERRNRLQRDNRMGGTLTEVRELLRRALEHEREALAREPSEDARFSEAMLDALPSGTAASVNELASYDWRSGDAREEFRRIQELLGREMLDSRFEGMKQAMRDATQQYSQEDLDGVADMMSDLNDLLEAHAAGEDTSRRFDDFMAKHGQFFPENPRDTDELIDALAARSAAVSRMLNSMSQEQRAELAQLAGQAFGDPRIADALSRLDANLRGLRPGEDWTSPGRFRGENELGLGEGTQAMQELDELDQLAEQLSQSYPGARLEDIDMEALERQLGGDAAVDARRLAELERQLREQGILRRAEDGSLRLSPKALRKLGDTALRDALGNTGARRGERDSASAGAAGEPTGSSRPWEFGDRASWDVSRTVRNAVLRRAATGDRRVALDVSDVEVIETEQRTRAAVALCADTSWSMVAEDRWVPMKRTALALHQLIGTRYRSDALELVTFGRHAQPVELPDLVGMDGTWEQGTNLHHALLLAGRHLRRHPDAERVVFVITDGEPTAHVEPDGEAVFDYPPTPRTLQRTLAQVDALARMGASLSVFMLGEDPRLRQFVDLLARRGGGRVLAPDADGLGAAVVGDYLRRRG